MTVGPTLARSSGVPLWISAHCSPCAPGGVSQRTCQSLCTDLTAPCAAAGPLDAPTASAAGSMSEQSVRNIMARLNDIIPVPPNIEAVPMVHPANSSEGRQTRLAHLMVQPTCQRSVNQFIMAEKGPALASPPLFLFAKGRPNFASYMWIARG